MLVCYHRQLRALSSTDRTARDWLDRFSTQIWDALAKRYRITARRVEFATKSHANFLCVSPSARFSSEQALLAPPSVPQPNTFVRIPLTIWFQQQQIIMKIAFSLISLLSTASLIDAFPQKSLRTVSRRLDSDDESKKGRDCKLSKFL